MTSIAAIVCGHTLDRWHDITASLESLRAQTRLPDEIVFAVDNNDELFRRAHEAFGGFATVVHNTGARGVSPARNVAAKACTSDVLAYLDDDATADPEWVALLVDWYDDTNVVGVGGTAMPAWEGGDGPRWFPASFLWVVGCSHSGIAPMPAPVRNFIGCNMSIRRSAWEAVGGFYDGLGRVGADGGGGDETDFCIRVTDQVGGIIMNDPAAVVSHRVPTARQTVRYFVKRCHSEGRSKAQITTRAGREPALAEERNHLRRTLPREFLAGLVDGLRLDPYGPARAAAIVLGTAATGFGYVRTALATAADRDGRMSAEFVPARVVTIDLDEPLPEMAPTSQRRLFAIVRRGTRLLGVVRRDRIPTTADLAADLMAVDTFGGSSNATTPGAAQGAAAALSAAVVIATRDRPESLERCLGSLTDMTLRPTQVIVIDNAPSDDRTRVLVDAWNSDNDMAVTYERFDRPGLGGAHNVALAHITADIVAFTDDDVLVDRHWLEVIVESFTGDDPAACVTGAIMPAEIETWPQDWAESGSRFNKGFEKRIFDNDTHRPVDDPLFPFTAGSMGSGANMAFSTEWLRSNGGFDPALGAGTKARGGDDLRAFYDVIAGGRSLIFDPDAIVYHHHNATADAIARQAHGYGSGLGAFLASVILDDPATLGAMLRRAPKALLHARRVTSVPAGPTFPGSARRSWRQRTGILWGPLRYLRSRDKRD